MCKLAPVLLVLISCTLLFITLATEDPNEMAKITEACLNKTGATMEMIRNYKPGEEEPGEEILCFIKCNFEEMDYLHDNGTVCVESMKEDNFIEGSDEEKESIYDCLEKLSNVKTCTDALHLENCVVGTNNE